VLHVQAQTVAEGDGEKDGVRAACENVGVASRASPHETRQKAPRQHHFKQEELHSVFELDTRAKMTSSCACSML
jgi:hypothetical protein